MSKTKFIIVLALAAALMLVCLIWLFSMKATNCIPGYGSEC